MKTVNIVDALSMTEKGDYDIRIDDAVSDPVQKQYIELINSLIQKCSKLENRSKAELEQNPMPILVFDDKFKIITTNDAYATLSGISKEKLLSMNAKEFKILEQKGEGLRDVIKNKKRSYGEVKIELPSGVKILEQYGIPILDAQDNLTNLFVVYNDVTELRKKMIQIEKLQKRSESIVQDNPYPILVVKPNMDLMVYNKAFIEMSGYSTDKLKGLSLKDFKYIKSVGGKMEDTLKNKQRTEGVATIEFPSGRHILEWFYIPLLDNTGNVYNILIVYNDITEKRLLEERLQKSIGELAESLAALSLGDLTKPAVTYKDDPLEKVKGDLNKTLSELRGTLGEILAQANQLEHAVIDVGKGADEIAKASQQVAITAQKTSDDVRTQIVELEKVTKEVSDLSASIEEIASTSQEVKTVTTNVAKEGNDAVRVGNEANSKMKIVQQISERAVNEITTLNNQMREISNIVRLITDIANQTNLLALNAAIEAARAGEHGRGFAVVAGEVRNLAGESKNATRNIEEVIGGITQSSEKTADAMKKAYEEIISGITSVNSTIDALNRMVSDVNISANSIADISRATEDQAGATNNVTRNVDFINNLILSAEKSMEDLAALAEESSASTEEVASASNEIKTMAVHLREMVGKFKVQ